MGGGLTCLSRWDEAREAPPAPSWSSTRRGRGTGAGAPPLPTSALWLSQAKGRERSLKGCLMRRSSESSESSSSSAPPCSAIPASTAAAAGAAEAEAEAEVGEPHTPSSTLKADAGMPPSIRRYCSARRRRTERSALDGLGSGAARRPRMGLARGAEAPVAAAAGAEAGAEAVAEAEAEAGTSFLWDRSGASLFLDGGRPLGVMSESCLGASAKSLSSLRACECFARRASTSSCCWAAAISSSRAGPLPSSSLALSFTILQIGRRACFHAFATAASAAMFITPLTAGAVMSVRK